MGFMIEMWGDYASFNRPELKVERVSYDVITPSAARGILDSIYWHPGIKWVIDEIYVLSPVKFTGIRRNEVKSKTLGSSIRSVMNGKLQEMPFISTMDDRQQRSALVLQDVRYVVKAHFEMIPEKMSPTDNEGKFCDIIKRRIEKGQCFHQPYFGNREFPARFRMWAGQDAAKACVDDSRDLGLMLFDMDYSDPSNIKPMFFRAVLNKGMLKVTGCEVLK
jgi:CRISPR-associated protein Cas5d